jgi:hypothetical protein
MYRVTAIGLYIADHLQADIKVDKDIITKVNLLHDMGNIVKFDFNLYAVMGMSAVDVPYWTNVQKEYIEKYGRNEDIATDAILQELNVEHEVVRILGQHALEKAKYALENDNWGIKIIRISDSRISPQGVVTLSDRWSDIRRRYTNKDHRLSNPDEVTQREQMEHAIEKQIQSKCTIDLQKISDADIEPYIGRLKEFQI